MTFQFKPIRDMLPSEVKAYVQDLENEIVKQAGHLEAYKTPNHFIDNNGTHYASIEDLCQEMEIGDVVTVSNLRMISETFKVKLSDTRIDDHDTLLAAEHQKMLHSL